MHFERSHFMNDRCERLTYRAVPTVFQQPVVPDVESFICESVLDQSDVSQYGCEWQQLSNLGWHKLGDSCEVYETKNPYSDILPVQPGEQGSTGFKGGMGTLRCGADGQNGLAGRHGSFGATGSTGRTGSSGLPGQHGELGSTGFTGGMGTLRLLGATRYIGPPGFTGDTGNTGLLGALGPLEGLGSTGPPGPTGVLGVAGPFDASGSTGATGLTGVLGPSVLHGLPGLIGPTGPSGATGTRGWEGKQGPTGRAGVPRQTGAIGYTAVNGEQGVSGQLGNLRSSDANGRTGATGLRLPGRARDIGATGSAGKPGDGGPVGWTDQSGLPGRDGVGGFDGFDCKNTDTGRQAGENKHLQPVTTVQEQRHQPTSNQPSSTFNSTPPPDKKITIDSRRTKTDMTPRKLKMKSRILSLKSQLWKLKRMRSNVGYKLKNNNVKIKQILDQLRDMISAKSFTFIETQIKMSTVRKHGHRWSMNMTLFALSIFYQSRNAYKLLQSIFLLPSHRTLQRSMQNSNINPGFNDDIFNGLKLKFKSVENLDKHCVLMFDEMALKTSLLYNKAKDCIDGFEDFGQLGRTEDYADHALVFMVRGLSRNWKQPLGYFLVSASIKPPMLQTLVRNCLSKLDDAGLFVSAIVCDQGPTNRCFLEKLEKVHVEQPFLLHNDRRVFVIYDPPHLLKNIRNNLKKYGFIYNDNIITWKYIEEFYNFDKSLSIRMAPRITNKHIDLPPFTNMRVNFAAQVLSHSVAAGINTLSILGKIDPDAIYTAAFIEKFDQLFNACNSTSKISSQKMGHAITNNTTHEEFLNSMLEYISKLKIPNSNNYLPCVNGWKITITAILMLWKELQRHGYKFLMTRRLNQDCLENLFSVIRGLGGNRDNPDVHQFRSSFRHVLIDRLFAPNLGSNCELDYDQILLDLQNILKPNLSYSSNSSLQVVPSIDNDDSNHELHMTVDFEASYNHLQAVPSTDYNDSNFGLDMTVDCETNHFQGIQVQSSGDNNNENVELDMTVDCETNLSLEVKNVAAYMGGYLLRKGGFHRSDTCKKCLELLTTSSTKKSEKHTLISSKTFQETGCLIFPSSEFCSFVEDLENLFITDVDNLLYTSSGIIDKLYNHGVSQLKLTTCCNTKCMNLTKYMIKLYMTVRVHFKIKTLNQEHSLKRNRKAKKIMHQ